MAYMCVKNGRVECDCCGECRGVPDEAPACPICGSVNCDYFYKSGGYIIGCDECIMRVDVWEEDV